MGSGKKLSALCHEWQEVAAEKQQLKISHNMKGTLFMVPFMLWHLIYSPKVG